MKVLKVNKKIKSLDNKKVLNVGDKITVPAKPNGNLILWIKENLRRKILSIVEIVEDVVEIADKVTDKADVVVKKVKKSVSKKKTTKSKKK